MDLDVWSKSKRDEIKSSHDNNGSHRAKFITPIDIQDAHIVHQYPNFFVLAPSLQERAARIALEEMKADTVRLPDMRLKHMTPRRTQMQSEDPLNAAQETSVREAETIVEGGLAQETAGDGEVEAAVQEAESIIQDKVGEESIEDEPDHDGTIDSQASHLKQVAPRSIAILKVEANPEASPVEHTKSAASWSAPVAVASKRPGMGVWKIPTWLETLLIIGILAVSGAAHAINMFNYPHYDQDEGTYMMYAWAVMRGMISPYAYGYGHPPLGWIQIAAWARLTGGFYAFGNALNSGRVLMLLYSVACTLLVYLIARHLGVNLVIRLLAVGIFTFSPLSITFQREVLLDNFATFWFLLSLYLIVAGKSHLFYIIGAAVSFGISLLSKEVTIVFFPVLLYVVWLNTTKFQRKFALVTFTYVVIATGSSFILMAVLKSEFFPYSWHLPWDHHPHLSMIDTYITQVGRGQQQGSIKDSWKAWTEGDPLLVLVGFIAPAFNLLTCWWNRKRLFLALFAAVFWFLLLRGGVVFAFYIIPLIPIIALNLAMALSTLSRWIGKLLHFELIGVVLVFGALLALVPYEIQHNTNPYSVFTLRPAIVQNEGMVWIRANVPRRAVIVISSNLFVDLHEPGNESVGDGAPYPYAHVYWFVALDPALHDTLLRGNWDRIDYIVVDAEILRDIQTYGGGMELIHSALNHSLLRVEFKGDNNEFIRIYQVLHKRPPPQP